MTRLTPLFVFWVGIHAFCQTPEQIRRTHYKADASLVLVTVTVMDQHGTLVNGLRPDAFRIFDDKVSQQIFSVSEEDVPASIGIILDMSGSMKDALNPAKFAVRVFLDTANPEDEAFLYTVSSRPRRSTAFTHDVNTLLSRIAISGAKGSTPLIDTIYCGLDTMRPAGRGRKALLVISDGMDNYSRYSKRELMDRVVEADVQIHTIAIYGASAYAKAMQVQEQRGGLALLQDLAERSGGLHFVLRSADEIAAAAVKISRAIRNQYTIAYIPKSVDRDGKWHSIQVRLGVSGYRVYARPGYYAE